jgi:hypothetical protein
MYSSMTREAYRQQAVDHFSDAKQSSQDLASHVADAWSAAKDALDACEKWLGDIEGAGLEVPGPFEDIAGEVQELKDKLYPLMGEGDRIAKAFEAMP